MAILKISFITTNSKLKRQFLTLICILFIIALKAQIVNFPIQNFSSKEYGKNYSSQNFCITQDKMGYLYIGNANGILKYDGKSWGFIPVKRGAYVTSIAIDSTGTIFVGTHNEFGYLKSNANGKLIYKSLSNSLKGIDHEFGTIIKTYAGKNEIYFQCNEKIFIYKKDSSLIVLNPNTTFHTSFIVNNEFYVRERHTGLLKFANNNLQIVQGGEVFAELGIFAMLPYKNKNDILIATMENGLYSYTKAYAAKQGSIYSIKTDIDKSLIESGLYGGIKLSDGSFAFNTLNKGVIILNKNLNLNSIINTEMGLRVNDVKQLFEDNQHNLWLALNNGISKVQYKSHLTYYADESGILGSVHITKKINNTLYIATSNGLFFQEKIIENKVHYKKINSVNGQIWDVIQNGKKLLAIGDEGIFQIDDINAKKILAIKCRTIKYDSLNNIWLIGHENGLSLFNTDWNELNSIIDINTEVNSIELERLNTKIIAWIGTTQSGLFHLTIDNPLKINVTYLGFPNELSNECIMPHKLNHQIIFGSSTGIYTYTKNNNFEVIPQFNDIAFSQNITAFYQYGTNIWLSSNNQILLYNNKSEKITKKPFLPIDKGQIHHFFQDSNICWISTDDGLIRYDIMNKRDFNKSFQVQITKVNCGKDSIIFYGNNYSTKSQAPILNYQLNSLYFEFAALYFEESSKNIYSYKLDGQDTSWSNWTNETKAVFTNLKEGKYTFNIKSKNIYETESNIATYSFIIKAPWHRTWIVYLLYIFIVVIIIYLFVKNRTKKLEREKEQLEKIVSERTAEVVIQKDEIFHQKHLIEEKHKEITDSINYAERIQRSLLATKKSLDEAFEDYFIFFKPKDVVSGDFYWASKLVNNHFCFVTADSTGHGVPGAIMSILNINALKDAVNLGLTKPSDILNKTRESIINTLSNDGSSEGGKDGMDCSALCFDFENQILYMALANNPVWIIRQNEFMEFKPDKIPVGKHDKDKNSFTLQTFHLQKDDLIYAITDGYSDQFGGEKDKKFNIKKLRELILKHSLLSMQKQKEILSINFDNWKGSQEQIDDVTVVGIKI